MSILVHPDKNQDDSERAKKAFDAVNKAYKTLNNEEGFKRCQEIVEEAKNKIEEMVCSASVFDIGAILVHFTHSYFALATEMILSEEVVCREPG